MTIRTIVLLSSLSYVSLQAKVVRTVVAELVEEKILGQTFMYRLDVVDGRKKEQWTINNRAVAADDYNRSILQAEFEERRLEREQEYQKRVKLAELKSSAAQQATKKLLATTLKDIEQGLEQFNRHELNPYLVYSSASFSDEVDFTTFKEHTLSEVRHLLTEEFDPEQAKEKLSLLESYPQKIANLFEHTVQNAINKCDDPKKLKSWLQMLS